MSQILADAETIKKFEAATNPVDVINDKGTVIGVFTPIKFPHSPYSREEIEKVRKEVRDHPERGRSLSEFMAELQQRGGGQV